MLIRSSLSSITVTILTKNSAKTLAETLDSLTRFPEILVIDTGSTDGSLEIAKKYPNVSLFFEPFQGFGKLHNLASQKAANDWILSIDSDEILSSELTQEISELALNPKAVYSLNRCNYFQGKWIKCCSGWYPDPVLRLYHRASTRFTDSAVHEAVIAEGLNVVPLRGKCFHSPYLTIDSLLAKMQLYTTLFAEENEGRPSSLGKALWRGFAAFLKNYFLKRGFLGGREGLILSLYNAQTTYYKYLKLAYRDQVSARDARKHSQESIAQDKADCL